MIEPVSEKENGLGQSGFDEHVKGFDAEAQTARRALRVSMALNVFGVGTLLPNDLPHDEGDRATVG